MQRYSSLLGAIVGGILGYIISGKNPAGALLGAIVGFFVFERFIR